jgi:hypothetical protein
VLAAEVTDNLSEISDISNEVVDHLEPIGSIPNLEQTRPLAKIKDQEVQKYKLIFTAVVVDNLGTTVPISESQER